MSEVTRHDTSATLQGAARNAFMRSHSIVIAATPRAVFDYVTNPKSWPQWLPSSHHIDCDDRPMRFGDTFHEHWSTRTGPVNLDWLVIACDPPRLWIGLTQTPFMGPIVVQYDCVAKITRAPQPTDGQIRHEPLHHNLMRATLCLCGRYAVDICREEPTQLFLQGH